MPPASAAVGISSSVPFGVRTYATISDKVAAFREPHSAIFIPLAYPVFNYHRDF